MRFFERDVTERLGRLETKLDLLLQTVHGREQPGMIQKMEIFENRLLALEIQDRSSRKYFGKIAAAAAFVINAGIAIGAWFR